MWTLSYLNSDLFGLLVMVRDVQELSKLQLDSLALVNEILLYAGSCLCNDICKAVVNNWSSYCGTNGHIVSGWFEWRTGFFLCVTKSVGGYQGCHCYELLLIDVSSAYLSASVFIKQ